MLSHGSSSVENEAALVGDRDECLADLSIPLETEKGIKIRHNMLFTGDHPAVQFEQGTKRGTYKCGACGCKECMFDDQGHSATNGVILKTYSNQQQEEFMENKQVL